MKPHRTSCTKLPFSLANERWSKRTIAGLLNCILNAAAVSYPLQHKDWYNVYSMHNKLQNVECHVCRTNTARQETLSLYESIHHSAWLTIEVTEERT